ncbi:uncharacterized protein LOC124273254 [Haliotis rubra]|uniref:uncharacterized protein LOC124273254 n=1 Tax=Haliotis rubra TaxID=36100 RepID=UPI001EE5FEDC|nr:uncharacterized protein LOC124273254 [Haliotis rubra]
MLIYSCIAGVIYRIIWVPDKPEVDKENCDNSCFDSIFKGSYEKGGSKHGYKHVYFNATRQTTCVWLVTMLYVILGYEAIKLIFEHLFSRSLRPIMAILFFVSVYPHIYAWWAIFNYYNDDFYQMFNHQIFFSVTEMLSTYAILKSCDRHSERHVVLYGLIVGTAVAHVIIGSLDQFISQIVYMEGKPHLTWRDIGLLVPDIMAVVLPVLDYMRGEITLRPTCLLSFLRERFTNDKSSRTTALIICVYISALLITGHLL